jgi:CRISPR-associated protein Cmr3
MKPVLIEPHDTLFFRDSIPMSAGQGRGVGARLPLPSTLHEAFRASLLDTYGRSGEIAAFRPKSSAERHIPRSGGWLEHGSSVPSHGSKDFQSLQIIGPFPFLTPGDGKASGVLFPLPLDLLTGEDKKTHLLSLRCADASLHSGVLPALAVSPVPARKEQASGFLTTAGMKAYLSGGPVSDGAVVSWRELFEEEYRMSVELSPVSNSAVHGQLYAATHARPTERFRILAWAGLKTPINDEAAKLEKLSVLTLGGERRMARLKQNAAEPEIPAAPVIAPSTGPLVIKWTLATSAVFANGWLPGWCRDTTPQARPDGRVCLNLRQGRAQLIATCLGKAVAFAGWDTVIGKSKPTQLAVPAGSVYYFLCENAAAAGELAALLHWRPRSDSYGEKGFGYGFASLVRTSPDILNLATSIFTSEP